MFNDSTKTKSFIADGISYELHVNGEKAMFRLFDLDAGENWTLYRGTVEQMEKLYNETAQKVLQTAQVIAA